MVELPFRGMTQALIRARIPYLPVHADHVDRESSRLALLILPNLGAMSAAQTASIRRFVEHGGGLIATGDSSLFDEWGQRRADFGLADLFGAHLPKNLKEDSFQARRRRPGETRHTYLRLTPEMRARIEGPKTGAEPDATGERHPALQGFDETDILPFGGTLQELDVDAKATVLMTFIPEFPIFPPETSWMREPRTAIPGLLVNTIAGRGRVAFLPADLDRRYGQDNLPDHGRLLANLARWCSGGNIPISVEGGGLIDCHLYHQPGRLILHLVNLTSAGTWRQPVEELIPTGPFRVRVRIPQDVAGRKIRLLVGKQSTGAIRSGPWSTFEIKSVLDHEVVVLE
jgi:hypothetical protein